MQRYKRLLVIVLGVVFGLALVGGITALVGYDRATKIDRSVTTVVVRQYIEEMMVRRDDERAALFTCSNHEGLAPFETLREQLKREEQANGTTTQVVPARLMESNRTEVIVDLKINQGSGLHIDRRSQTWRFSLKGEDGWRVCSAEQMPDLTLTPTASVTPPTTS